MTLPAPRRPGARRGPQPGSTMARRIDPYREMEDFYDRLGRLWQTFFVEPGQTGQVSGQGVPAAPWSTLADIEETDDAFLVEIDLPGVKADDIHLELRENELHISGEYKE